MDNNKSYKLLLFRHTLSVCLILILLFSGNVNAQNFDIISNEEYSLTEKETAQLLIRLDSQNRLNEALREENTLLSRENLSNQLTIENRNFLIFSILIFSCLALFLAFRLYISIKKAKFNNKILKLQNLEIAKQKKELEELNKLKIKFLSIISHDIRSPLLSLKGVLNLFDANLLNDKDEINEFFSQLKSEYNATSYLLDNLLIWAKKQMYEESIEKVGFPINVLIRENLDLQNSKISKCNISVFNLLTDDIFVFADKEMINLVIRNLITNSLKFTSFGGEMTIFYKIANDFIEIGIRDTGIGISKEQIRKIFNNTFFSTVGLNNEKGNGLGLMLCKDFIDKNNGELRIESKVGSGSTFFFTLPLFKNANENLQRTPSAIPVRTESVI